MEDTTPVTSSFESPDPRLPFETAATLKNAKASCLKVAFIGLDEQLFLVSQAFNEIFGARRDLTGTSLNDIFTPEALRDYQTLKVDLCEKFFPIVTKELSAKRACGTIEPFLVTCSLTRNPDGAPQYIRAIFRDLKENRQMSAMLKTENATENGHVFVGAVDKDGVFTRCEGELSWNLIVPEVIGRHFTEVYAGISDIQERIRRALAGEHFDVEVFWQGVWFHVWYRPLLDSQGHPCGAIWTAQTIDREKQKELRLRASFNEQCEATRLRDEMLSMAAHEIRGPLATLSMHIQLLEMKIAEGETPLNILGYTRDLVDSGRRQINHVSKLLEKTLDISRIRERGFSIERRPCDLSQIVRDVANRCAERIPLPRSALQITIPEKVIGYCDPIHIGQVIDNLLSNAFKYGEGRPILIRLESNKNRIVFEVQDQGPGIAPADQEKIFERFERGQARKDIQGFGMGLYIVKRIVTAHGGTVRLSSQPGSGATFTVEIPIVALDEGH